MGQSEQRRPMHGAPCNKNPGSGQKAKPGHMQAEPRTWHSCHTRVTPSFIRTIPSAPALRRCAHRTPAKHRLAGSPANLLDYRRSGIGISPSPCPEGYIQLWPNSTTCRRCGQVFSRTMRWKLVSRNQKRKGSTQISQMRQITTDDLSGQSVVICRICEICVLPFRL